MGVRVAPAFRLLWVTLLGTHVCRPFSSPGCRPSCGITAVIAYVCLLEGLPGGPTVATPARVPAAVWELHPPCILASTVLIHCSGYEVVPHCMFMPTLIGLFVVLLSCKKSSYILCSRPFSDKWFTDIPSTLWVFIFSITHVVLILMKPTLFFFCCLCFWCQTSEESLPNPRSKIVLALFFLEVQLTYY